MIKEIKGGVTAPKGFTASGIYCGIRKNPGKFDLALIFSETMAAAAGVYTTNLVKGAPITVTQKNIENGYCRAIVCNSGNANTCAQDGEMIAMRTCDAVAAGLGIDMYDVAVASTGVIGQVLPVEKIIAAVPALVEKLSVKGGADAAKAILTTDLVKKEAAVEFVVAGKKCRIGGIAKGSGMIKPNMATMLAFLTCDAEVSPAALQKAIKNAADKTFNRISVDGDTSTNDTLLIMANGASGAVIRENGSEFAIFEEALFIVCNALAKKMARDGEGATKLITCTVSGASSEADAVCLAKSVIESNLVKAAMFGRDANWGRVLCALGYAGVNFSPAAVSLSLCSAAGVIMVCENGMGLDFDEAKALEILSESEIEIMAKIGDGAYSGYAYGCDLTYDYVKINGDYRT